MKIYFVRHGETDWNKERKIQGQVDIPLNEFGRHLARETAKGLRDVPFDVCFTSPLGRARETAQIILQGRDVPILEDKRILEMNFGVLEGKCCSKEGWDVPDSFQMFFDDPVHYQAPEGGRGFPGGPGADRGFSQLAFRPGAVPGQHCSCHHSRGGHAAFSTI